MAAYMGPDPGLVPPGPLRGALDGGVPISHVEFKKWQCPLSLLCIIHVDFKSLMSNLGNGLCHVTNIRGRVLMASVKFRNTRFSIGNLRFGNLIFKQTMLHW